MGREVKRVPLDFNFPINASFADHFYEDKICGCSETDDCKHNWSDFVPKGEGWQLWQTVSDGPISPVFKTPEELIEHMIQPQSDGYSFPTDRGYSLEEAKAFVYAQGWAPSFVMNKGGIQSGVTALFGNKIDGLMGHPETECPCPVLAKRWREKWGFE